MCKNYDADMPSKNYSSSDINSDYSEVTESNEKTYDESNWQDLMDDAIDFASTFSDTLSDRDENVERNEEGSAYSASIESSDGGDDDDD